MRLLMIALWAMVCFGCASVPMRVGQTYEVIWSCQAGGCATEIVTILDIKHGWAVDENGYRFRPDRALAFRPALRRPQAPNPHQPVRAEGE